MHKTRYTNKSIFTLAIAICTIAFALLFVFLNLTSVRLSPSKISELRKTYPICGINVPPNMSMRTPAFTEIRDFADTYVYGTVVGDYSTYTKQASTGIPELDKKRESQGLSSQYTFYEYTINVLKDTNNIYNPGDEITIAANIDLIDYYPRLKDGMKVVVPVIKDKEKETRASFSVVSMYYVTENDYVLSAFDEKSAQMSELTGIKVDSLLKKLSN